MIPETVARRFERGVIAANHVFEQPPDMLVESEASRLFGRSRFNSVTLADLADKGDLSPDFLLGKVVAYAVPFTDMNVGDVLKTRSKGIVAICSDYNKSGVIPNAAFQDAPSIKLQLPDGKAPTHNDLCRETWPKSLTNPVWETAGLIYRNQGLEQVQANVDKWRGAPRMYSASESDSFTAKHTMASMTKSMMLSPRHDSVLVACRDKDLGSKLLETFGEYKAQWTSETDPVRLKKMALEGGFNYINRIGDVNPSDRFLEVKPAGDLSSRSPSLPETRALIAKLDVVGRWAKAATDVSNDFGGQVPDWLGRTTAVGAWVGPLVADLNRLRSNDLQPANSKVLERSFDKACEALGAVPGVSDYLKAEAMRLTRGAAPPSWKEIEYRVDSAAKPLIGFCVTVLSENPKLGMASAKYAGLFRDTLDAVVLEPIQSGLFCRQMVGKYREYAHMLQERGYPAPTMTEWTSAFSLPQDLRLDSNLVARQDAWANASNASLKQPNPSEYVSDRSMLPTKIVNPVLDSRSSSESLLKDEGRKFFSPFFPPGGGGGGAAVDTPKKKSELPPPPPPPPPGGGGAGLPPGGRMPPGLLPSNLPPVAGVGTRANVVKGQPVQGGPFAPEGQQSVAGRTDAQSGIVAPLLLFCAAPESSGG